MKDIMYKSINNKSLITNDRLVAILAIQSEVLKTIYDFLHEQGLIQIMPVILSPITDPLNHSVYEASIEYMGQNLLLTKSMIFHKQIAISKLGVKGIYIISPNVRLEKSQFFSSKKHLLEFSQLDIELKEIDAHGFMSFIEDLVITIFSRIKETCIRELELLNREIMIPKKSFRRYTSEKLEKKFGIDFETIMSLQEQSFFWITDYTREFYDKEDPERCGHYLNYDLFYPEGFGEALSGGERDYEYEILLRKLKERNYDPNCFRKYLEIARKGLLKPSTGGGLGIERLIRFISKSYHIKDITLFPKVPGEKIIL